jgi:O-antigen/teichoic acid export membrane protein
VAEVTVLETLLAAMCTLGLDVAVARTAAQLPERRPQLLGVCLRVLAITAPLVLVADAVLIFGPLSNLTPDERFLAAVVLGLSTLNALTVCLQAMLIAEGALGSLGLLRLALVVGPGAASLVLFAVGSLGVVSYLTLSAIGTVGLVIGSWRALHVRPARGGRSRPLLKFAAKGFLGSLLAFANINIDQAFIGPLLGRRQLGYYAIAVTVATLPVFVSQAIAFRSFGPMTTAADAGQLDELTRPVRTSFMVGIPSAVIIGLASPLLLAVVYGRSFQPALVPLLVLLPGAVALGAATTTATTLLAAGRPGTATMAQVSGVVVTAFGLPLALYGHSIVMAAVASTVSYVTMAAVGLTALKRLGGGHIVPLTTDWREAAHTVHRNLPWPRHN